MQEEIDYSLPKKYVSSVKQELCFQEPSSSSTSIPASVILKEGDSCVADTDYVGYANLPHQIYRNAMRRGFEFTLMVIGESGLGKSTFINNLFLSDIYGSNYPGPSERIKKTIELEQTNVLLIENGVNLYLTVVDVPGFGDSLNNSGCWAPIVKFLDNRHQEYVNHQNRYNRGFMVDTRVHCCLYFISPWGYGLKPLDIEVMKQMHDKVNIVPVIAKADIFTQDECEEFKRAIMKQIEENEIQIYDFTSFGSGNETYSINRQFPLAVMGSLSMVDVEGKRERGRRYPWGTAEVQNVEHCDFVALRNLLVRSHLQSLKDTTNNRVYENFRRKVMSEALSGANQTEKIQEEKRAHELKLKQMTEEMECLFDRKIGEKLHKLKELEAELELRSKQMVETLEQENQELEDKRAVFEMEKAKQIPTPCERKKSLS